MKTMSFSLLPLSLLAAFALVGTTALTSCQNGGCTVIESDNYDPEAKKNDGSCVPWRNKFIGTYSASKTCTTNAPSSFTMTVAASSVGEQGLVLTFGSEFTCTANVIDRSYMIIAPQSVNIGGNTFTLSGSGTFSDGSKLTVSYTLALGILSDSCTVEGDQL